MVFRTHLLMVVADLDQREDLGWADDGRIHASFTAVVQENRIEGDPSRR